MCVTLSFFKLTREKLCKLLEKKMQATIWLLLLILGAVVNGQQSCNSSSVMNGVKKAQMNGCPLQVPIYDIAYEATENRLFAIGFGGMVYQIDADTMIVTNSSNIDLYPFNAREGLSVYVNDTINRLYAIFVIILSETNPPVFANSLSYMVDTHNLTVYSSYTGNNAIIPSIYTKTVYDIIGNRIFYIYTSASSYSPRIDEVQLGAESFTYIKNVIIDEASIYVGGGLYLSGNLYVWAYLNSGSFFEPKVYTFYPYSSYSNGQPVQDDGKIQVGNGVPYNTSDPANGPPFQGFILTTPPLNFGYKSITQIPSNSYVYVTYQTTYSQGSAIVQFSLPIIPITNRQMTPRTLIFDFDNQFLNSAIPDETKQVLFVATGQGQVQKYSYYDIGYIVLNNTYNFDNNLIDEFASNLDSQIPDLTNNRIFYASSDDNGGIWMMPLYACSYQTSCNDCISLGDPYCGWCPLSDSCTTQSNCSTHALTNGWSQSTCPSIQHVSSPPVPVQTPISISISALLIPNPGGPTSNWMCTFTRSNSQNFTTSVTADNLVAQTFNCTTPAFTSPLSFNESVTLTLTYQGAAVVSQPNAITIYDCGFFTTCNTCQSAPLIYNCGWCLIGNQCTTSNTCPYNSTSAWLNPGESCPTIIAQITPTQIPIQSSSSLTINISPA